MIIRIGYELQFTLSAPTPMLLMLYVHPSQAPRLLQPEEIVVEPDIPIRDYQDEFGNRCGRILAPAGTLRLYYNNSLEDSGEPEPAFPEAQQHPVEELPDSALTFLLASRYCEVDRMSEIAWNLFGTTPPGWQRVQAICDWLHTHITFGYEFARPTKTACDVYAERNGVCRDFMHLAITFCRCLNIPARYATGYLGDIGVPPSIHPMDFSAFFEVYLDGAWHPFDARNNQRRIGRVLMGRGRDAVDVALTTSFGTSRLDKFTVWTDEIESSDVNMPV